MGLLSETICDQTFAKVRLCAVTGAAAAISPATTETAAKALSDLGAILLLRVKVVCLPSGTFPLILVWGGPPGPPGPA
jgi:hypothetical protein